MLTGEQAERILKTELLYRTSRSGGKGGQHVNKVESKVEISFNAETSEVLNEVQKSTILSRIREDGPCIRIISEKHRSQLENKLDAQRKLITLLQKYLKIQKRELQQNPLFLPDSERQKQKRDALKLKQ